MNCDTLFANQVRNPASFDSACLASSSDASIWTSFSQAKWPQLVAASPWALAHYWLVSTNTSSRPISNLAATPTFLYLTMTDPFFMFRLELFLFDRQIDLDPQRSNWESQYFSIKDPVLFFQNDSFFLSTRSCSCRLQSKNSRAPLQARAGKLFL